MPGTTPRLWRGVLAGFLVFLMLVGFRPSPVDQPIQGQLTAFLRVIHALGAPDWINYGFIEAAANVALFVPLGALDTVACRASS